MTHFKRMQPRREGRSLLVTETTPFISWPAVACADTRYQEDRTIAPDWARRASRKRPGS
jgi:hypothetical protein